MAGKKKQTDIAAPALSSGVLLVCFGRREYYFAAYNMAVSIKHYNPDIYIRLVCDKPALQDLWHHSKWVFDDVMPIDIPWKEPADIKLNLDRWMDGRNAWLYLDVDGIALKDISPILNQSAPYKTFVAGNYTTVQGRDFPEMQWAWMDDVYSHYGLDSSMPMVAINSSIQYINTKFAAVLYKQARELYANPIPIDRLRMKWGKSQPDELYTNIALSMLGMVDIEIDENAIGFRNNRRAGEKWEDLRRYYLMSYYGGRGFTGIYYTDFITSELKRIHKERNEQHIYKLHYIIDKKHANNR
jgi:hypothetical protein